jgi:hypothetical protein
MLNRIRKDQYVGLDVPLLDTCYFEIGLRQFLPPVSQGLPTVCQERNRISLHSKVVSCLIRRWAKAVLLHHSLRRYVVVAICISIWKVVNTGLGLWTKESKFAKFCHIFACVYRPSVKALLYPWQRCSLFHYVDKCIFCAFSKTKISWWEVLIVLPSALWTEDNAGWPKFTMLPSRTGYCMLRNPWSSPWHVGNLTNNRVESEQWSVQVQQELFFKSSAWNANPVPFHLLSSQSSRLN